MYILPNIISKYTITAVKSNYYFTNMITVVTIVFSVSQILQIKLQFCYHICSHYI